MQLPLTDSEAPSLQWLLEQPEVARLPANHRESPPLEGAQSSREWTPRPVTEPVPRCCETGGPGQCASKPGFDSTCVVNDHCRPTGQPVDGAREGVERAGRPRGRLFEPPSCLSLADAVAPDGREVSTVPRAVGDQVHAERME